MTAVTVQDLLDYNRTAEEPIWETAESTEGLPGSIEIEGLGVVSFIASEGGVSEGDHYHVVFSVMNTLGETTNFRKDGYYDSYNGVNWEYGNFYEAFPISRTIIEWGRATTTL